jgi:uncharacterized protein (TIGR02996 family)
LYEHVSFNSYKAFEENAPAVFDFGPITEVHFWSLRSTQKLFTSPWVGRIRGLRLFSLDAKALPLASVRLGDAGLKQLIGDRLPRLRALAISKNELSENGFRRWVQASRWPHLTELTVEHNSIGDRGLWELGCSPNFPALRTLDQYGLPVRERFVNGLPPLTTPMPLPATALAGPASLPEQQAGEDGLLEAMLIAPHDPVPRLVYADWLEEQGETDCAALMRLTGAPDEALLARVTPDLKVNDLGGALVQTRFEGGLLHVSLQMRGMLAKTFQRDGADWLRRHRVFGVHLLGSTKLMGQARRDAVATARPNARSGRRQFAGRRPGEILRLAVSGTAARTGTTRRQSQIWPPGSHARSCAASI